jgi:hypothetical protein
MKIYVMECVRFGVGNGKTANSEPGGNKNYTNFICPFSLFVIVVGNFSWAE